MKNMEPQSSIWIKPVLVERNNQIIFLQKHKALVLLHDIVVNISADTETSNSVQ